MNKDKAINFIWYFLWILVYILSLTTYVVNSYLFCKNKKNKKECDTVKKVKEDINKQSNTGDWRTVIYSSKVLNFLVSIITFGVYSKKYKNLSPLLWLFLSLSIMTFAITTFLYTNPINNKYDTLYKIDAYTDTILFYLFIVILLGILLNTINNKLINNKPVNNKLVNNNSVNNNSVNNNSVNKKTN